MMQEDYQMFKIVIIGSMGTGKTNLSIRFIRDEFNSNQKSTVGVQFLSKIIQIKNQNIKVTLWDTAGQQRYKSLSKVYYKGASGILIVYDITDPQSYLDVESWMRLANQNLNLNEVVLIVLGNKSDLDNDRKVPTDRPIRDYKDKFDIDCWQASAKTGYNVNEVFTQLFQRIYQKNIDIKPSILDRQSCTYQASVVEPIHAAKKIKQVPKIQEIIIEQQAETKKSVVQKSRKNKKHQNNISIKANDDKKKKNKKQDGGCC